MPPLLLLRAETSNNSKFILLFEHIFLTTRLHHLYLSVVCGACVHVRVSVYVCVFLCSDAHHFLCSLQPNLDPNHPWSKRWQDLHANSREEERM